MGDNARRLVPHCERCGPGPLNWELAPETTPHFHRLLGDSQQPASTALLETSKGVGDRHHLLQLFN